MSAVGQTQTSASRVGMSDLAPIADIVRPHAQVRSVPIAAKEVRFQTKGHSVPFYVTVAVWVQFPVLKRVG
jgi:ABC-type arginine/histidine transport system permease subunit